jgi:hypothetical protein
VYDRESLFRHRCRRSGVTVPTCVPSTKTPYPATLQFSRDGVHSMVTLDPSAAFTSTTLTAGGASLSVLLDEEAKLA